MTAPVVTGTAIGRYFTVVSLVPSVAFVAYLILLSRSGAWSGEVDFAGAVDGLTLKDLAVFGVGSLVVAMALHPLQFAIIQAFEGFWGRSRLGRRFAIRHIMRHRRLASELKTTAMEKDAEARPEPGDPAFDPERDAQLPFANHEEASAEHVGKFFAAMEAWRLYGEYADDFEHIMPTRLGNVLRRYELLAGLRYGLDTITMVPRLIQVADPRDVAYVQNQRTQMELALRTSALAVIAAVMTVVFMWRNDLWLLLALVPYALAFASYRGAVVIAHEYGTALAVLIDLNRSALYERMHLPFPDDIEEEREHNRHLVDVLRLDNVLVRKRLTDQAFLDYTYESPLPPPLGGLVLGTPYAAQSQEGQPSPGMDGAAQDDSRPNDNGN